MSVFIQFFKAAAILSDGLHLFIWLLWLALCASGLLKIHEIDPDFSGIRAVVFYGTPFIMIAVLSGDALRLWFADEKHRMLWLSMAIRTVSVLMLLVVAGTLLGPRLYQLYHLE